MEDLGIIDLLEGAGEGGVRRLNDQSEQVAHAVHQLAPKDHQIEQGGSPWHDLIGYWGP